MKCRAVCISSTYYVPNISNYYQCNQLNFCVWMVFKVRINLHLRLAGLRCTTERGVVVVSTLWLGWKVHQDPKRVKGGSDRPDSRSRSFHAPAPSTHPIHSYLKAVTHWLQNGIDYWFPSHLRSAVIAAVSGLAERQPVERREAPAGNTQAQMHVHTFH